jgi:hypothetical protein
MEWGGILGQKCPFVLWRAKHYYNHRPTLRACFPTRAKRFGALARQVDEGS